MEIIIVLSILLNITLVVALAITMLGKSEWILRHDTVDTILKKYIDKCIETFGEKARMVLQEVLQAEVDAIEKESK